MHTQLVRRQDRTLKNRAASVGPVRQEGIDLCGPNIVEVNEFVTPVNGHSGAAVTHSGQEFVLVLSGCVRMTVDTEAFDLQEGDCLTYSAGLLHHWENTGATPARMFAMAVAANPAI